MGINRRTLKVGTDTFTTFYVAALPDGPLTVRLSQLRVMRPYAALQNHVIPNLECLFTVSYGMSREELERLNFEIKARSPVKWEVSLLILQRINAHHQIA
jgi:hypothetical protein